MNLRKHSKKRNIIMEILCSTKTHPTAQWVYEKAKGVVPDLSLATVYRNLRQLKDDGLIRSAGVVEGEERFDGICNPHPHFVCESCSSVLDLDLSQNVFKDFTKNECGQIDYDKTVFYGICKNCINNNLN